MTFLKRSLGLVWATVVVTGTLVSLAGGAFGLLDSAGVTQNATQSVFTLPDDVGELVKKAIRALDIYIAEKG